MDYVKISRKILEWEWYKDVNTKVLFFHILLKANWKNGRFQGMEIPRGSFVTSYQSLAEETGLTVMNVRTAIKHLKLTQEITVSQHSKFSVITVKNYDSYQTANKVANNQLTGNQQATNRQLTTIEERKNIINLLKEIMRVELRKAASMPRFVNYTIPFVGRIPAW